jgi:hypothetical protein
MFRRETYDNKGNIIDIIEWPLTQQEKLSRWEDRMNGALSNDLENIIDALDAPTRARIAQETKSKYDAKKVLRAQKP